MTTSHPALLRAEAFARSHRLRVPILLAPMAGACPSSLSIAVANAGGLGSCGALLMQPDAIRTWAAEVRAKSNGAFAAQPLDPRSKTASRYRGGNRRLHISEKLGAGGRHRNPGDVTPPDFAAQCEAMLEAAPPIISSVMGLYPAAFVDRMKAKGIKWFANISTVTEARAAQAAGADAVVAQGMEAGGHRGAFDAATAEANMVGLFSLIPAVVDAVDIPVVATGGIADARGVAAALLLGASAAQVGTGFLRCPEAKLPPAWADAIGRTLPEQTIVTRAFSGRPGRAIATAYARAAASSEAPNPAPYPVQRGLTQAMRNEAVKANDIDRMQPWAGQSGALASARPAGEVVSLLWEGAQKLLG